MPHDNKINYKFLTDSTPNILDQDVTYAACFDIKTYEENISPLFRELRQLSWSAKPDKVIRKKKIMEKIDNVLRRSFYDQTVHNDQNNRDFEAQQIVRKLDRITIQGLSRMAEIFAGESSGYYLWMIAGKSQVSAELGDWKLYDEKTVTSILENGYTSGSGTIIKHGAAFSPNDPTEDYFEFAARDFPTFNEFQTVWFRSVIDEPVKHEQGKDIVIVGHAAYLISVSDFEEVVQNNVI